MAIRVDVTKNGKSVITTKEASGAGGYDPGKLVENKTAILSPDQTHGLIADIQSKGFWGLAGYSEEGGGDDGSEWIIEGVKDGKYHVVTRWTPANGPARDLGISFISLAKLSIPEKEMY